MLRRFLPREENFFELFRQSADQLVQSATEFRKMLDHLEKRDSSVRFIQECEHRADTITHTTVSLLHKTFITPLDRDDIHKLISRMDDILDLLEGAAQRFVLFDIKESTPEFVELADVCLASANLIHNVVDQLHNLKNPEEILKICIEINRLENDADHILGRAVAKLFKEETDFKKVIMLKEVYEFLEAVTDRCEDVANIVEGIVLEYA